MNGNAVHWRANFLTGLAILLPVAITLAVVRWLFGTISNFTETLLIFLPSAWTHAQGGDGPLRWYASLLSVLLAGLLTTLVGSSARHYLGRKLIRMMDVALLRIPLLNKIYGTVKQVNSAISADQKTAFKQVVLVEFPRAGSFAVGFVTGEKYPQFDARTGQRMVCVFVPTTPNPTGGFMLIVPAAEVTRLDMSVAEGIKFIISLGALAPERELAEGRSPFALDKPSAVS